MKKSTMIILGVIAIVVVICAMIGGKYNSLVSKEEKVDKELSNIDVNLKRRADLIPNLVNTVKGYAAHEEKVINSITEARENLTSAKTLGEKSEANEQLTTALNNLMVVVENYPDLKADTNFLNLQDELAGTENRIATSRRDYNEAVTTYNTAIKKFPTNILAGMFGFSKKDYFEVSEEDKNTPNVEF